MLLSFILFFFLALAPNANVPAPVAVKIPVGVNKTLLLQLVNNARRKGTTCKGKYYPPVSPLTWNDLLEKAAEGHSRDMKDKNYFSHLSPGGSDVSTRLEQAGYNWKNYGENIGMGFTTEQEAVEGWLNSPGHCKNIMNGNYRDMGVARSGDYWTQDFGSN